MIVWTIQPLAVLDIIEKTGVFRCDTSKSSYAQDPDWTPHFKWMVSKMDERDIHHPEGVEFPVWAWYRIGWDHPKPDLRKPIYGYEGEMLCRIELEIPDNEVLLSDFEDWYLVCHYECVIHAEDDEEYARIEEWYKGLPVSEEGVKIYDEITEISWDLIFDIDYEKNEMLIGRVVQAAFWEIRKDMIRDVKIFRSRKSAKWVPKRRRSRKSQD